MDNNAQLDGDSHQNKLGSELTKLPASMGSFFLDSGAHSLYNYHVKKRSHIAREDEWDYYKSAEFETYLDKYTAFIEKFKTAIDYYANVDVIFNPELSWDILKRLESRGLSPVPVIHHGTDVRWVEKHIKAGYKFIGIGGMAQGVARGDYRAWVDQVFRCLCPKSNDYKPLAWTHGFAMTSYDLLTRYPWWSVDSASWIKAAAYGMIYLPLKHKGKFAFYRERDGKRVFDLRPSSYAVSSLYDKKQRRQRPNQLVDPSNLVENYESQPNSIKNLIQDWLDYLGIPLGKVSPEGEMLEFGVISHHKARAHANLRFFSMMAESKGPFEDQRYISLTASGFFK